jgi:hypothetical protein
LIQQISEASAAVVSAGYPLQTGIGAINATLTIVNESHLSTDMNNWDQFQRSFVCSLQEPDSENKKTE